MTEFLLSILKKEQEKHGYISEEVLKKVSKKTGIPISRVYGVATFYAMLKTEKQGKNTIEICNSPSCHLNGSFNLIRFLEKELKLKLGESNNKFSLYATSCIGCCNEAPAMLLNGSIYGDLDEKRLKKILEKCK